MQIPNSLNEMANSVQPAFQRGVNQLLPVIAQDVTTHQVLMMAWMNREAFDETLSTGYATYFSRSKQRLWRKGEESGHRQKVIEIYLDCDEDTILLLVEQTGAACHEGFATCFFRRHEAGNFKVVGQRIVDPKDIYKQ